MKRIAFLLAGLGAIALFVAGCFLAPEEVTLAPPALDSGTADFSNYVALGNSLSAGYQSGALYQSTQQYGFVQLLAGAMGSASFEVPWIDDPGFYSTGDPENPYAGHLELTFGAGGAEVGPSAWPEGITSPEELLLNADLLAPYSNCAVPGATAYDLYLATEGANCFTSMLGEPNGYFDLILRNAAIDWSLLGGAAADLTPLEQALLSQPTFMTVWIGNNELLMPATAGMGTPFYPASDNGGLDFETFYGGILGTIAASLPETEVVVANVPPVTATPYFTTVPWCVVDSDLNPVIDPESGTPVGLLAEDSATFQLVSGDLVTLKALSYVEQGMGIPDEILIAGIMADAGVDADSAAVLLPALFPLHGQLLPGDLTLVASEVESIISATVEYNDVIDAVAGSYGYPVVDAYSILADVAINGAVYDGITLTAEFISGGMFSLDGVHPSNLGHAFMAGKFMEVINASYGSNLSVSSGATIQYETTSPVHNVTGDLPMLPGHPY